MPEPPNDAASAAANARARAKILYQSLNKTMLGAFNRDGTQHLTAGSFMIPDGVVVRQYVPVAACKASIKSYREQLVVVVAQPLHAGLGNRHLSPYQA